MDKKTENSVENGIVKFNKSMLLNWLYSSPKEIAVEELVKWITAKTGGKYTLIKTRDHT
jgi:hypothetical protein